MGYRSWAEIREGSAPAAGTPEREAHDKRVAGYRAVAEAEIEDERRRYAEVMGDAGR